MAALTLSDIGEALAILVVFGLVAVLLMGGVDDPFYPSAYDLAADREPIRGE